MNVRASSLLLSTWLRGLYLPKWRIKGPPPFFFFLFFLLWSSCQRREAGADVFLPVLILSPLRRRYAAVRGRFLLPFPSNRAGREAGRIFLNLLPFFCRVLFPSSFIFANASACLFLPAGHRAQELTAGFFFLSHLILEENPRLTFPFQGCQG